MKRQRKMDGNGPAVATRRRAKSEVAAAEERRVVDERREFGVAAAAAAAAMVLDWEEWPQWSWVNEQMSWGTFWCPSWDMEYLGEAYNALYSDVVWDDDIWDLKEIKDVPNP